MLQSVINPYFCVAVLRELFNHTRHEYTCKVMLNWGPLSNYIIGTWEKWQHYLYGKIGSSEIHGTIAETVPKAVQMTGCLYSAA